MPKFRIDPFTTPEAPTPTPAPQNVDPPVEGQYQVRLGMLSKTCDPAAQPFAPSFTTAALSQLHLIFRKGVL